MVLQRKLLGLLFSGRVLVFCLALYLVWPARPSVGINWLNTLEYKWAQWSQQWRPSAKLSPQIQLVTLNQAEWAALQDPWLLVDQPALQALLASNQQRVLLLPELPRVDISLAEQWLRELHRSQRVLLEPAKAIELGHILAVSNNFERWLQSEQLSIVLPSQAVNYPEVAALATVDATVRSEGSPSGIGYWFAEVNHFWREYFAVQVVEHRGVSQSGTADNNVQRSGSSPLLSAWPYQQRQSLETTLLWRDDNNYYPTLALYLAQRLSPKRVLSTAEVDRVLILGGKQPPVIESTVDFVSRSSPASLVLIAANNPGRLQDATNTEEAVNNTSTMLSLATQVSALLSGDFYLKPAWFEVVRAVVIVVIALSFSVLGGRSSALAVSAFASVSAIGLVIAQQGLMLTRQQWLPVSDVLVFITIAWLLMVISARRHSVVRQLRADVQRSHWQLATMHHAQGGLDKALAFLQSCPVSEERLQLSYQIGIEQEQKRQYQAAADTFSLIAKQRRNYRDASERAQQLYALSSPLSVNDSVVRGPANRPADAVSMTQTVPLGGTALVRPLLGRYEIERELGRGAMGVVYLGSDPKIGRKVAIKTLNYHAFDEVQLKDLKERFFREAEAAGRLDHPAIVTVYDVGEERDLAYIAMDYVEGEAVSVYASADRLLPVSAVYRLIADVADALDYAHQHNIVHRDIKPGNIIYNAARKQVKVADFGIARITDDSRTRTGDVLGSPVYMSPEQIKGAKITGASDLYSLGATFYQLLTGQLPFSSDSLANLAYQVVNQKPKSVRDIRKSLPASAVRLVNKAMHKDPAKRFANGAEMAAAIRKSLARDFPRESV